MTCTIRRSIEFQAPSTTYFATVDEETGDCDYESLYELQVIQPEVWLASWLKAETRRAGTYRCVFESHEAPEDDTEVGVSDAVRVVMSSNDPKAWLRTKPENQHWWEGNAYCPICWCNKSGDEGQWNSHEEPCDKYDCDCHDEELVIA